MKSKRGLLSLFLVVLLGAAAAQSQQIAPSTSAQAAVPHLVRFSGSLKDSSGHPLPGIAGVTFALYKEDQGGAALWIETQNVQLDSSGRYSVMLGATKPDGLPTDLFTSSEARWLGVQPEGQAEQPRVLLVSVPYAMKAADAETIGGLPASAFMRAPKPGADAAASSATAAPQAAATIGGTGKVNYLPIWTGASTIGSSTLFEKTGKLGIGTTTPATTLDVNGAATIRGNATITGTLSASSSLTATSGALSGSNSSPILNVAQAGTGSAVYATTASVTGSNAALQGVATAATGSGRGIIGASYSDGGEGVLGIAGSFGGKGSSIGVYGISTSSAGTGVSGSGSIGVYGSGFATAGLFQASNSGLILKGLTPSGANVFSVDQSGNLSTAGTLSGATAAVAGNGLFALIGDPGCGGFGTTAIGFSNSGLSNCSNYAVRGDTGGNLYINSSSTGWMFFDHNNTGTMSLDPSGNLGVQGTIHTSGAGNDFGLSTDNNASQARSAGGFIKAMAYIDPYAPGGVAVVHCFNSQMTGAAITTPPCGITLSQHYQGSNVVDFGFQVNDRFVQITPQSTPVAFNSEGGSHYVVGALVYNNFPNLSANQVGTSTFDTSNNARDTFVDFPFYIFVY